MLSWRFLCSRAWATTVSLELRPHETVQQPPAFASKSPAMALNIPTFITLHAYGYENIYELGPLLDVRKTKIPLAGSKLINVPRPVTAAEIQN